MDMEKEIEQIKGRLAQHEKIMKEIAKAVKRCSIAVAIIAILHFL